MNDTRFVPWGMGTERLLVPPPRLGGFGRVPSGFPRPPGLLHTEEPLWCAVLEGMYTVKA